MNDFSNRFPTEISFGEYIGNNFENYPLYWTTGGVGGGNCWGEGGHYPIEAEDEPQLTVLDDILVDVYPLLTFVEYRKLDHHGVIKVESFSDHEYYGNYTNNKMKSVDLSVLYRALSSL